MPMKKVVLFTMLLVCILSSTAVYGAWAQTQSAVGVQEGDNFTYNFEVTWVSSNQNLPVPEQLSTLNQTHSIHMNVTYVGSISADFAVTTTKWDGTQTSELGHIGVVSGMGTQNVLLFIIAANLTGGEKVYPESDSSAVAAGAAAGAFTITETVTRTYLGVTKTVNHFHERNTNETTGDYGDKDAYYDQQTGVLMEMTTTHYVASTDEVDTEHWKIVQFNTVSNPSDGGNNNGTNGTNSNGGLPDLLTFTLIGVVVAIIVVLAAVLVSRRRKKPQIQAPPPSNPFAEPPQTPI